MVTMSAKCGPALSVSRYHLDNIEESCGDLQDLQPQLIKTVGEVEALMVRIAKEKAEVVQPKAAAVAVDEAAAQAKVSFNMPLEYCLTSNTACALHAVQSDIESSAPYCG